MRAGAPKARAAAIAALLAAFAFSAAPATAQANPDMSADFTSITDWLAHELAQGLAFNAGETFDPPHEIIDKRLQPDLSVGIGAVPLDKSKFPVLQTPALQSMGVDSIFPNQVLFPNLVAHLRAGLPGRMDFAIRGANMTTPPNYQISQGAPASGQSNSIGFTLRRHFLGYDDMPLLTLGAHYNHVYGQFAYNTKFGINPGFGYSATADVNGDIQWNINSVGATAVLSQRFGHLIPFAGVGYNRASGSVRASLEAVPNTFTISRIYGQSSEKPESNQGRVLFGTEYAGRSASVFLNGEIKAIGIGSGKSWIVHTGVSLPFHIGWGGGSGYASSARVRPDTRDRVPAPRRPEKITVFQPTPLPARKEVFGGPKAETAEAPPPLLFIQ